MTPVILAIAAAAIGVLSVLISSLLGPLQLRVDAQNASMSMLHNDAALLRLHERVDGLSALLGGDGEGPGVVAARLRDLAELARDTELVERRRLEVRGLLSLLDNSSGPLQELLHGYARGSQEAALGAVDHLFEKVLEPDFWALLRERLADILGPNRTDPRTAALVERARARAEAEVQARYDERNFARLKAERMQRVQAVERLKGDNEVRVLEARVRAFNESLSTRVAWLLCAFGGVFGLALFARLLFDILRRRITTPQLVDETSVGFVGTCARRGAPLQPLGQALEEFFESRGVEEPRIVLAPDVQASVRTMAFSVGEAAARGLTMPNSVFYGPPGTGKTLTARRLAHTCGLDYAVMSGGNVIGLREQAVPEVRRVLRWAQRTRSRGLVLFIDEADAFLGSRASAHAQDPFVQAAVSFFLAQTSEGSTRLLVILATNRLEALDPAVISRMSYPIEFGTPGPTELHALLDDRLHRAAQRLGNEARERFCADLEAWASPSHPWEALHARGFAGRDVQNMADEFARQWRLREALGTAGGDGAGIGSGGEADGPSWLRRWLSLRDGRLQYVRRAPARAAAAA